MPSLAVPIPSGDIPYLQQQVADPRIDPAANSNAALRTAAGSQGHFGIVKILLVDLRVNPTARSNAALVAAAPHGSIDVLDALLDDARVMLA